MKVSKLKLVLASNKRYKSHDLMENHCPGEFIRGENILNCPGCGENCINCWKSEIDLEELFSIIKVDEAEETKLPKRFVDSVLRFFTKKEK